MCVGGVRKWAEEMEGALTEARASGRAGGWSRGDGLKVRFARSLPWADASALITERPGSGDDSLFVFFRATL